MEEINEAKMLWVLIAQDSAYREEKIALQDGREVHVKSRLRCLAPVLEGGLLKKSGRLQEALLSDEEKNSLILPPDHPFVQLLAEDMHRRLCHAGTQQVLAPLRDEYWVVRGRQVVRSSLRNCPRYAVFRAQPFSQVVAPLPSMRVRPSPPFSHTGVDLGGLLLVRGEARDEPSKLYFAVFACAVTRAIHLELVSSCATADFMKACRRFSARRGTPMSLMSDNASNFKGAGVILASEGVD